MKLHIFNPEHDLALASNDVNFYAPHAIRQMRSDMSFLPALWSESGDCVITDDPDLAYSQVEKLHRSLPRVLFKKLDDVQSFPFDEVDVWGWDVPILQMLLGHGIDVKLLPSKISVNHIRRLSNRRFALTVLREICSRISGLCGEGASCRSVENINELIAQWHHVVLKAPWSSSGRGIRFANAPVQVPLWGWCENILKKQVEICVEPYYNKVRDFGMEFQSDGCGGINYCGLSVFKTDHGAYMGNIIATEKKKMELINKYVSDDLLMKIREELKLILGAVFKGIYRGPFGVDMMVVAVGEGRGFTIHPCVEINLRRTMGHVALSLIPDDVDLQHMMHIVNDNSHYNIKLIKM
jgi:hypothetical protein